MKECCIKCDHAILDNSGLVENYICINRGCVCHKDTPQSNTDWLSRLAYLKDFPVSPDPECTVSVYEEVSDIISQLLEAEKKRLREACVKKSVKDLWPEADIENPTELLATQIAYKNGYNAALDAVLQKLS